MHQNMLSLGLIAVLMASCSGDISVTEEKDDKESEQVSAVQKIAASLNPEPVQLSLQVLQSQYQDGPNCPQPDDSKESESASKDDVLCAQVKFNYPKISSETHPELAAYLNTVILQHLVDNPETEEPSSEVSEGALQAFADAFIAEYKEDPNPYTSWELERSASVVFRTDNLLTLLFEEYGYTGGAHPFSGRRYLVMSLKTGDEVVLADLLNPGYETPLNVIGEKAFRELRNLDDADSLEEHGFSFENDVFSLNDNFGVLREGLEFIFNSYEIAPYAMGPTELLIAYEDINSLIRSDGPLGESAQ